MSNLEPIYTSYLLRVWHEGKSGAPWRAMLENISEPGRRYYFKDLESLVAFIQAKETGSGSDKSGKTESTEKDLSKSIGKEEIC